MPSFGPLSAPVNGARCQLVDMFSHIRKSHAITQSDWKFHPCLKNFSVKPLYLPDITVTAGSGFF
jgi:hypothetical protein